jgi:phosphoglycolate phosphatase
MSIEALIFDFDGTLAELTIDFAAMCREVEALASVCDFDGPWPGDGYLLEQVQAVAQILGDGFAARAHQAITSFELACAAKSRLFPFALDLLARARQRGLKLAIISRNCEKAIRVVFPAVDQACDLFLPREAVPNPKPHPNHLAAALGGLGVAPARTAVGGDHFVDVTSALAAGCLAVGVASGCMSRDDLARAGAALVLDNALALLDNI